VTGLVFGQPEATSAERPASNKRKLLTSDYENFRSPPVTLPLNTASPSNEVSDEPQSGTSYQRPLQPLGPSTTNSTRPSRPGAAQITPPKGSSRRHSFIRQSEWAPAPISEVSRDSISSNGSWMRRLSIRPLSQHGSPRSSVVIDSPSITFSHGSAAPIITPLPPQQPRNKLVKRETAGQQTLPGSLSRRASRTLRRPATSHQRSATLQQFQYPQNLAATPAPDPKYSLDQQIRPAVAPMQLDTAEPATTRPAASWTSFFHSKLSKGSPRVLPSRSAENSPSSYPLPNRRIHIRQGSVPRAYLITTSMMAAPQPSASTPLEPINTSTEAIPPSRDADVSQNSAEGTPAKRARRSISMHFSSPSNWISRTGSLRRPKRGSETKPIGARHVSAPVTSPPTGGHSDLRKAVEDIFTPPERRHNAAAEQPRTRQRNSSSPLPPLSRLSSFHVDLNKLGAPLTSGPKSPSVQDKSFSSSHSHPFPPHSRDVSNERASTLTGSDLEMRGFVSGDDDDTDFKSETMFDSLRTAGSARVRSVETPLESMFDESPPSTAGNSKTKRLSIQEILGRAWDADTKIMEEDEGVPTPIRGAQSSYGNADFGHQGLPDPFGPVRPSAEFSLADQDFGRLSLDDDNDDWALMDENGVTNHLSPPSSSVNSRGVSPNLRQALASISGNGSPESTLHDAASERPRSNVFDWTETSIHDKFEVDGQSPRPKTVHGKQEMDVRGGRSASRKGPIAAHVRSQSVPVIPDLSETTKSTSKFGTWASGPKNSSDDWGDDFDFELGGSSVPQGKDSAKAFSMIVPESIKASQSTVKAHSGQIREFSLLVNGLKRLCRHGRDLDLLDQSPALWAEAENIIALASPDEEDAEEMDVDGDEESGKFDPSGIEDQYLDDGFDAGTLHSLDDPFEPKANEASKTAVLPERKGGRRQSVFSPEDDIFGGNWPLSQSASTSSVRPQTPDRSRKSDVSDTGMINSIMEAMQQQRSSSVPIRGSPIKPSKSELFFNTNTLQELVKRANTLFHALSEIVRRAELITQSPACTPRRERHSRPDVSPAFTRVFTDPSSPPRRLQSSLSRTSVLSRDSAEGSGSSGMGSRMHMMTVS
jgi:hypothetical protein